MGSLTIRNLDDHVIQALKAEARANDRSMEAEARRVLRGRFNVGRGQRTVRSRERIEAPSRLTEGILQTDSVLLLREDRTTLKERSIAELLALHVGALKELRTRGVLRGENNPAGDLAEYLFCAAYGWQLEPGGKAALDATDTDGKRYQIKGRRLAGHRPSRQLSAIRDVTGFDTLAAVLFDDIYRVMRAALIPAGVVRDRSSYTSHTNSYTFRLQDEVWGVPDVIDATDRLRSRQQGSDWLFGAAT